MAEPRSREGERVVKIDVPEALAESEAAWTCAHDDVLALTVQRDSARDIAVALEQENAALRALFDASTLITTPSFVNAKRREHRTYDSRVFHESHSTGERFVCGWCGGWGHLSSNTGGPRDCHECDGLGWYVVKPSEEASRG